MNFSELFEDIQEKIETLDKKMLIIISALIVVILLCLVLLVFQLSSQKKTVTTYESPLILSEKLYIPNSPDLPKDYNISRKTQDKWSEEETEKWFTVPSSKDIDSLSLSNDKIINEIIEAAP